MALLSAGVPVTTTMLALPVTLTVPVPKASAAVVPASLAVPDSRVVPPVWVLAPLKVTEPVPVSFKANSPSPLMVFAAMVRAVLVSILSWAPSSMFSSDVLVQV